jgi:hypothetical protein
MAPRKYTRPPVVERVVAVYCTPLAEVFDERLHAWVDRLAGDYPINTPFPNWEISIEQKNANEPPIVKDLTPRVKLFQRSWKSDSRGKKIFGYDIRPDRLVFRVTHEDKVLHDFVEIQREISKWSLLWMEHFGISHLTGTSLEYVNEISADRTPQLFTDNNPGIPVGEILKIFASFTGHAVQLCPPLDCQIGTMMDPDVPRTCFTRIFGVPNQLAMQVLLTVSTAAPGRKIDLEVALSEIDVSHTKLLEHFRDIFTEEALKKFE